MNLKNRFSGKLNMSFKTTFSIPTALTINEKQISCKYNFRGLMVKATNQNGFESRWCHIMDEATAVTIKDKVKVAKWSTQIKMYEEHSRSRGEA